MADKKISQLTDGTSFQAGDEAVVNRGGVNYKVDPTQFAELDVIGNIEVGGGVYLGGTVAANLLDDYEEGTFTPALEFGGAAVGLTTTVLAGEYTKVGRLVYIRINVRFSSKGTSTGDFKITGLPFTAASVAGGFSSQALTITAYNAFSGISDNFVGAAIENTTTAGLYFGGNSVTALNDTNFTGTSSNFFSLTGCYVTS